MAGCGSISQTPDETANWPVSKLYTEAKDALDEGNFSQATKYFEKLQARDPLGVYGAQARLYAAYAHYKDEEPAEALAEVNRFIRMYPDHPSMDYAYYLKGIINFNDDLGYFGKWTQQDLSDRDPQTLHDAYDAFTYLVQHFPKSTYVKDSSLRLRYIVNTLAAYDVRIATYYYKRGAYLAAIARAQLALKNYDKVPVLKDALIIAAESYKALGMTSLQNDMERILQASYADTKENIKK